MHFKQHPAAALIMGAAFATLAGAQAQAAERSFNIAPQDLATALREFGLQSERSIAFNRSDVTGRRTAGAIGVYEEEAALRRLLNGTRLTYVEAQNGWAVVRPSPPRVIRTAAEQGLKATSGEPQTAASAPATLEEIVVTAQKASERLQAVPAAVTAVAGDRVEKLGITTLTQVANLAPGLAITPVRSQAFIFVRGVGQTLTTPNADPAVAVNVNGVYVPSEMSGSAFFDVERIEVVPGPQGTLYGRNATGGVINLVNRRPGAVYAADGFVEVGNYGRLQALVGADLPITETLAVRATVTRIQHDGYYDTGEADQKTWAGRLTGVWKPTDRTRVSLAFSAAHDGGIGDLQQNIPVQAGGYRHLTFDPKALGYSNDTSNRLTSLEIAQEFGENLTLTYLGGYNTLDEKQRNSIWSGPPPALIVFGLKTASTSHELRLNGQWGQVRAIAGLYAFDIKSRFAVEAHPNAVARNDSAFTASSQGQAAFGQVTYSVAERLRLTGGLRLSHVEKTVAGQNLGYLNGAVTVRAPYEGSNSLDRTDWRLGAEFDLARESMVYGSIATGFTPGGFSTAPIIVGQLAAVPFKPVYLTAYTAGIKNTLLDGAATLNLEVFHYDYRNYQVSQRNSATGQNNVYTADKATIEGVQVDGRLAVGGHGDITAGVSYLAATMDRIVTPAGDFSGLDLPFAPHWTANLSYRQGFDMPGGASLEALINFQYTSSRWALYTHSPFTQIGANTHTDVSLTYSPQGRRWSAGVWVRNLEDKVVESFGSAGAIPGPTAFFLEPPRTYGARATFKY